MKNLKIYKKIIASALAISLSITGGVVLKKNNINLIDNDSIFFNVDDDIKELKNPKLGIDLSSYNNDDKSNWDVIADNFSFAILRSNIGLNKDKKYDYYYDKCIENNIPTGAYFYNKCMPKIDFEEFKNSVTEQSDYVIEILKNKKITYPVYLDLEDDNKLISDFNEREIYFLLNDWLKKANNNGYIPGIYCNKNVYQIIKNKLLKIDCSKILSNFELWIAGSKYFYNDNSSKKLSISDITWQDNILLDGTKYEMNQISNIIYDTYFPINDNDHLDVNYCYVDYDSYNKNTINKKNSEKDVKQILNISLLSLLCLSSSSLLISKELNKIKVRKLKRKK